MTFFWLILWLVNRTPEVFMWNNWAVGLGMCLLIDFCAFFGRLINKLIGYDDGGI